MLKVLFAGTPDVAVPSLKLLAQDTEHFEVVAVLTRRRSCSRGLSLKSFAKPRPWRPVSMERIAFWNPYL